MRRVIILCIVCWWAAGMGSVRAQDDPPAPPLVTLPTPLAAGDLQAGGMFGASIAVDGDTAVIGAPSADGLAGAVYVLVWDGITWAQQAKLPNPTPASEDGFGHAVAMNGDRLLVGAPRADVAGRIDSGEAHVYARSGAIWTLEATLTASDLDHDDLFGWAVALDGDTAVIGAPNSDLPLASDCGTIYAFARSGSSWVEGPLVRKAAPTSLDHFGWAVALQGGRLAVGEDRDAGVVTIFSGGGTAWTIEATVQPGPVYGQAGFGAAVALDGDTLAVGSPRDWQFVEGSWQVDAGSVYLFGWDGAAWVQQARVQAEAVIWQDAYKATFGEAIALQGDVLLVGADAHAASGSKGAAYVFAHSGGVWSSGAMLAQPETFATFGAAVGLASGRLLVGSPLADLPGAPDAGTTYAYRLTPGVDLALTADHAPLEPVEGQRLDVTFSLTNAGPDTAAGVQLDVTLPDALVFASATVSQGTGCAALGADVICELGAIAPGAGAAATITAVLGPDTVGTTFSLTGSAAAQEPDLDNTNNAVTHPVTAAPYRVPPGCYPAGPGVVVCTSR